MRYFTLLLPLFFSSWASALLDDRYARLAPGDYARSLRNGSPETPFKNFSAAYVAQALATPTDWVALGAVTPVKDQGAHGYCGTFGRVAAAEGQFAIKTGTLVSFSEQELISCIGWDKDQYSYFAPKGFMTSTDFPYNTSGPDMDPPIPGNPCVFDPAKIVPGSDRFFFNGSTGHATSEDQLVAFIHHNGPTTIGIDANVFGKRQKNCEATNSCFITSAWCRCRQRARASPPHPTAANPRAALTRQRRFAPPPHGRWTTAWC